MVGGLPLPLLLVREGGPHYVHPPQAWQGGVVLGPQQWGGAQGVGWSGPEITIKVTLS